jgi:hypothetical protein
MDTPRKIAVAVGAVGLVVAAGLAYRHFTAPPPPPPLPPPPPAPEPPLQELLDMGVTVAGQAGDQSLVASGGADSGQLAAFGVLSQPLHRDPATGQWVR